jgi:hypothetical protein
VSHPRLVTPQGISEFLGRDIEDDDFLANLMCSMASQAVRSYVNQMISYVDNDAVNIDGSGSDSLLVPQIPVVRVNSVTTHDRWMGNETLLEEDDFVIDNEHGILWRVDEDCWPRGHKNIILDYDHGWSVGVDTGSVEEEDNPVDHVPADILLVALRIATRGFLAGTSIEGGGSSIKASETISPDSYSYTNVASDAAVRAATQSAQALATDETTILDEYRLERVR